MLRVLADEESVACADDLVKKVVKAMVATLVTYPGTNIGALSQVLFMVNGQNWMSAADMARARLQVKKGGI